jgi:hypothetical protein
VVALGESNRLHDELITRSRRHSLSPTAADWLVHDVDQPVRAKDGADVIDL